MNNELFREKRFTWDVSIYSGYIASIILFILLLLAGSGFFSFIVGIAIACSIYLWRLGRDKTVYTLTDEAIHIEMGILNRITRKMPLKKVQDVTLKQSFIQKQFNVGDLYLESAGESGGLSIQDIVNPQEKMEKILDIVHKKV